MNTFDYKALDSGGGAQSGTLAAESRDAAVQQLLHQGLQPVQVVSRAPAAGAASATGSQRVSHAQVESFTRQLASLLAAGVPLSRGLNILCRESASPAAQKQWLAIHDDVVGGMPLAEAMAKWPKSFPTVYVAMVRAGETGGFLDLVLGQIADFHSREQDLKGRIKAALVYPAVLAVLATGVLIFLMTFFIPRFRSIFSDFGGSLPWLTRAIMAVSEAMTRHGIFVAVAVTLVALIVHRALQSEAGRRRMERAALGAPLLGRVVAGFALVRFCRMLGALLGAGVPLISALRVAREAIGNQTLADAVAHAVEQVQRGAPLSRSLAAAPQLFSESVVEMVAVAEESSRLDKELVRLAGAQEAELDRRLRMLVALAEPAMLFIMAGFVGTIVIGMLLPIFTLQELIH